MKRRDFFAAATVAGIAAAGQSANADVVMPGFPRGRRSREESEENERPNRVGRSYILLEFVNTGSKEKRDALLPKFDEKLIPLRHSIGFDKVGIFTVNDELMKNERGYEAEKYDGVVFLVQETLNPFVLLTYQERSAKKESPFNLDDDLDFIDEEIIALRSFASQPQIAVPYTNKERVLQLRTYNSPNYERNFRKEKMFEDFELDLFRRSGMNPVFFGSALFGSWAPNVTYMLSFENDEARREGWGKFVNSEEWKTKSKDPQYDRTATRIRNLFLKPSEGSEI